MLIHTKSKHIIAETKDSVITPHMNPKMKASISDEEVDVLRAWIVSIILAFMMRLVDGNTSSTSVSIV